MMPCTDPRVNGTGVIATTASGIVTLAGSVDNLAAKTYAVAEAKKINGVLGVIDQLSVTPSFRWDTDISNAVRRRLLKTRRNQVAGADRHLPRRRRRALAGTVDSYAEQRQAQLLASEVGGVKGVTNNIFVKSSGTRSDLEIKNDAVAAIGRDVYLTGLPITVAVKDGIVALSGSVGNAYEKDRATDDVGWIVNVKGAKNDLAVAWYDNRGVKSASVTPLDEALGRPCAVRSTRTAVLSPTRSRFGRTSAA